MRGKPRTHAASIADEVQFLTLIRTLLVTYKPEGVHIWLSSPNKHLDGQRPIELCQRGSWLRVQECADRIEGGW